MATHPIRIGDIRRIGVYRYDEDSEGMIFCVSIQRQSGGTVRWYFRDKTIACLRPQPATPHEPTEVIRVIEQVASLGRRAYLRSLAGIYYRNAYP